MSQPEPTAGGESEREDAGPESAIPATAEPGPTNPETPRPETTRKISQTGGEGRSDARKSEGIVGQVVGTTSFFAALLFYMGWNYDNAQLSPFFIPTPQSIGLTTTDFAASGIYQLFASNAVFFVAVLVAIILVVNRTASAPPERARAKVILVATRAARAVPAKARGKLTSLARAQDKLFWTGLLLTIAMLVLIWPQDSSGSFPGWLGSHIGGIYLALALLAGAQLMMTWPTRTGGAGQVAYSLALLLVAVLALWAGGVYASTLGGEAAVSIENNVDAQPAVAVYSVQPLDLSGRGVTCTRVQSGPGYSYECTGLRLLYLQAGTYYLLPEGWRLDERTYILDDSDQIRVELYQP